jgi:uncharacterized membrane protein
MTNLSQHSTDSEQRAPLHRAETYISTVLRGGVILSMAVMLLGVVLSWISSDSLPAGPHTLAGVISGVAVGSPSAIIMFGILTLLVTPIIRVVVSVGVFIVERDWRFVAITLLVLMILLASFLLGKAGA